MVIRNRLIIALIAVAVITASVPVAFATPSGVEGILKYDIGSIKDVWESLPDEELNAYIENNSDDEIYAFIEELSEDERQRLLAKDTMLNNQVSIDKGDGTFDKMPYYDWIMKNSQEPAPMMFSARGVNSTFTAKSGYCFYRFVDNNSGYVVKYKVTFTLDSKADAESATNGYTVASVISGTSGKNTNNTKLDEVTFAKQKTYMQKAKTSHKVLGDGTSGTDDDGDKVYRTAITPIFVITVKVKKPAYTYGEWATGGFKLVDGTEQELASGSRFNFKEYDWLNTKESTFDKKVYHKEVTDTLTSCVNILSCGFTVDNVNSLGLAEGVPEHDTINVVYKHPRLDLNFYVNGGTVKSASNNTAAANPVERTSLYNFVYSKDYGLPLAANLGFSKEGYSPKAGAEWKTSDGSITWDEADTSYKTTDLKDFTDGTYFVSMSRSMYVNWDANVYKVTLDNQGADFSGTESAWYKYNTYKNVTLADGTTQTNYFYKVKTLATPLASGYKIVKPTKAGYTFKGYYSKKNGKGTQYVSSAGSFVNKLWKQIGPHTIYAHWVKKSEEKGQLVIKRNLEETDYYRSHGEATFLFKIASKTDPVKVYYRNITFDESDLGTGSNGVISRETVCELPYGQYTVEAMEVYRYENLLNSISPGSKKSTLKGEFQLNAGCEEVTAVYDGTKVNWAKFSHNDTVVNSLK